MIIEPSADIRIMAITIWQVYSAHIDVGFSPEQAMEIVLKSIEMGSH